MHNQAYIARQPILDKQQKIIGYELLFRHSADASTAQIVNDMHAGTSVLVNTLSNMGTKWLLGDKLAFINIGADMLHSDFLELLPPQRVVLELLEDVEITPKLLTRCRALRAKGFHIALDDYEHTSIRAPLLEIASYVKADIQQLGREKTAALMRSLEDSSITMVAEKVETKGEFQFCKELGFNYFQGYHFAHPETLTAKVINPAHSTVLNLLDRVRNNAQIKDIENGFKGDVALSFKLLRYINSVGFGLSCEIQSIQHALAILGYQQLYRWLTLLLATASGDSTPPALTKTAITRGRLTELLGQNFLEKTEWDNLFIVGIFSLLDAMLEMPMDDILDKLHLSEPISDALLNRKGIYGPFLMLTEACEDSHLERIEKIAGSLQMDPEQVNNAHLEALAWVEMLGL
ncbi:MAG: EAL domain-containing protein [Pseudomonadota bacterium]|jgi:EAL and modified HD-GYP domain-containing signal transduction protein